MAIADRLGAEKVAELRRRLEPEFVESARAPEVDEDTGFEFPPDPDMAVEAEMRPGYSPFRPDWERARGVEA